MTADEIIGECGQSIVLAIGPAVLDRRILALDIAGFAQAPTESGYAGGECYSRPAVEEPDHRHSRLLRGRRDRPHYRAAEQRDELAPFHCPMPPVLPAERIAHLSTAVGCCAAGFQPRLCLNRVLAVRKRLGARSFGPSRVVVFGIGYALIAAVSGRTPMMLITLVIL